LNFKADISMISCKSRASFQFGLKEGAAFIFSSQYANSSVTKYQLFWCLLPTGCDRDIKVQQVFFAHAIPSLIICTLSLPYSWIYYTQFWLSIVK
jgi:hypothetical protein